MVQVATSLNPLESGSLLKAATGQFMQAARSNAAAIDCWLLKVRMFESMEV
jgi:hypothetical protein